LKYHEDIGIILSGVFVFWELNEKADALRDFFLE